MESPQLTLNSSGPKVALAAQFQNEFFKAGPILANGEQYGVGVVPSNHQCLVPDTVSTMYAKPDERFYSADKQNRRLRTLRKASFIEGVVELRFHQGNEDTLERCLLAPVVDSRGRSRRFSAWFLSAGRACAPATGEGALPEVTACPLSLWGQAEPEPSGPLRG